MFGAWGWGLFEWRLCCGGGDSPSYPTLCTDLPHPWTGWISIREWGLAVFYLHDVRLWAPYANAVPSEPHIYATLRVCRSDSEQMIHPTLLTQPAIQCFRACAWGNSASQLTQYSKLSCASMLGCILRQWYHARMCIPTKAISYINHASVYDKKCRYAASSALHLYFGWVAANTE